ncbi:hypothetical protein FACS189461_3750 [Spirochaetia bacterium]|nr:hypothetical protein FACS189461_3750 [Spirochaetia bacterium]
MKAEINNILHKCSKSINEICAFRAMAEVFKKNPPTKAVFVEETHGGVGKVEFFSTTINDTIKREIADLLIIVNNKIQHEMRMSFMQAKIHKNGKGTPSKFLVDVFQYELLRNRPQITPLGSVAKKFPPDILKDRGYKSITSYGVFYFDNSDELDFLYTIPESMNRILSWKPGITKNTKTRTYELLPIKSPSRIGFPPCKGTPYETICTYDIDQYEADIINGYIGEPIRDPKIAYSLLQMVKNCTAKHEHKDLFEEMENALSRVINDGGKGVDVPSIHENGRKEFEGNMNMLIINTDGFQSPEIQNR